MSDELYKVEKILDKKFSESSQQWLYLVKWENYDSDESTWEPEENLCYIPGQIQKFNQKWNAKKALEKHKRQTKLQNLAEQQKQRLLSLKLKDKTMHQQVIKANKTLDLLEKYDDKPEMPKTPTSTLKINPHVYQGTLGKDKIVKIIGFREFDGEIYVALVFRSADLRFLSIGVVTIRAMKRSCKELMGAFLLKKLKE